MASSMQFKNRRCCPTTDTISESTLRPRRPKTSVFSIIIPNTINEDNKWIEIQITKGSWVLMQPRRHKHNNKRNLFKSAWKGCVKDFKIEVGRTTIKKVLVQHVYMHNERVLDREDSKGLLTHKPNCKSDYF